MGNHMDIDPKSTAVLALHFIRDAIEADRPLGAAFNAKVVEDNVLGHTATVLRAARAAGVLVVYARVVFPRDYVGVKPSTPLYRMVMDMGILQEGGDGIEIVGELKPEPGDVVIDHSGTNAFNGGELHDLLRSRGVDTVVLAGVTTNVIVEGTARAAENLGLSTFVLSDCCSADQAAHDASLATLGLITSGVLDSEVFASALKGGS